MHPDLRHFVSQMVGTALAALVPVVLTAFVSMPVTMNGHPGEPPHTDPGVLRHMT